MKTILSILFSLTLLNFASPVFAEELALELPRLSSAPGGTVNSETNPHRGWLWETIDEPLDTGWALYIDNDLFALRSSDQDYTGGLSITLAGKRSKQYPISLSSTLERVNQWFGIEDFHKRHNAELNSLEFGFTVFTPEDLGTPDAQQGDRPYASLLFLSHTKESLDFNQDRALITTFSVGVLGADIVAQTQTQLHKAIGSETPVGWNNQISDGGELTFRYSVAEQSLYLFDYESDSNLEVSTTLQASLGYISEVSWGISGRYGRFNTPWYSFRPQFNDYSEKSNSLAGLEQTSDELYLFGGVNLHLRAYNAFLQGQFRDSAVTFSSSEVRPLIAEAWLGVSRQFESGWKLSYLLRAQTSDVKQGLADRSVIWGGLIVSRGY